MVLNLVWSLLLIAVTYGEDVAESVVTITTKDAVDNGLANTDLIIAFVIFRHGDRTPDQEELELYPQDTHRNLFFPYGMKALTNKGKQRGFRVGEYLRKRYDGLVSRIYLPDEIVVRTTDYARTKMTALTALAAMYPPRPAQRWNPLLDWQPIPYDTLPFNDDDLLYWYNCPRYLWLRNQVYDYPKVAQRLKPYQGLFNLLSEKTGRNITNPEDVFYLDNLFQAMENVGVPPPTWAEKMMARIKTMTKIEYNIEFYEPELIRLATGVLLSDLVNATKSAIGGDTGQPKLRLYSGHENNVAALMAAARVFQPHQPNYGATFSLEFRRRRLTGQYGITAVYSSEAGGPGKILPITGCGGGPFCDYDSFLKLTLDSIMSQDEFVQRCPKLN